jgi:hypothetical protein
MNLLEKNVRDAHQALAEAVAAARAGGYRVDWPETIAISETAAVKPAAVPAKEKIGKAAKA